MLETNPSNEKNNAWKRMRFKKNKVWVALGQDNHPGIKNGKVLIKYQLDQDHEYWVHEKSVISINDEETANDREAGPKPPMEETATALPENTRQPTGSIFPGCDPGSDSSDIICLYTDGASSGNPGLSGIGVVLRYREHKKEISRHIGIATNNIAELEAIRVGLLAIRNKTIPVRVYTDSAYAYGLMVKGWKARSNKELVKSLRDTVSKFKNIQFVKVKGHSGDEGNDQADRLATSAAKEGSMQK
jgi:ribonuclease HI